MASVPVLSKATDERAALRCDGHLVCRKQWRQKEHLPTVIEL